jgi:cell division protein FtsB
MEDPENAAANRFFHQIMKLGRELNGFPAFARKYADCQNLEQVAERARVERDDLVSQRDSLTREVSDLRENVGALQAQLDEVTVSATTEGERIRTEAKQEAAEAVRVAKRAAEAIILDAHAAAAVVAEQTAEAMRVQQAVIDNMLSEKAQLESDMAGLADRRTDLENHLSDLRKKFGG